AHYELAVSIDELAPHAVQVDGVRHHGVVHQHDAQTFVVREAQGLRVRKLLSVEGPDVALHVAGQVQLDLARGAAPIEGAADRREVRVRQHAATVAAQADAGVGEARV